MSVIYTYNHHLISCLVSVNLLLRQSLAVLERLMEGDALRTGWEAQVTEYQIMPSQVCNQLEVTCVPAIEVDMSESDFFFFLWMNNCQIWNQASQMRFAELTWLNDSQLVLMMIGFLSDPVPLLILVLTSFNPLLLIELLLCSSVNSTSNDLSFMRDRIPADNHGGSHLWFKLRWLSVSRCRVASLSNQIPVVWTPK